MPCEKNILVNMSAFGIKVVYLTKHIMLNHNLIALVFWEVHSNFDDQCLGCGKCCLSSGLAATTTWCASLLVSPWLYNNEVGMKGHAKRSAEVHKVESEVRTKQA